MFSGTTGQPKGACISHGNVRSAIYYQGKALGFHAQSRVWDFAPYSFDVAWSNVLHSLCAGACLCVPNEQDMLDSPSTSIAAFGATLINVTPTMLRTITSIPPTLQTVLLSGEMPYRDNAKLWADRVTLINTYGPSECTWKCAFSRLTLSNNERPDLGYGGPGLCLWIVNANDNNQLAALGETGELYLEGPLVGQGYLANSAETSKAFTYDPPWLLRGCPGFPGRRGRLYKTGDLLKRNSDGKVVFVGRKDSSQLKIRGQRVEIGDVEHHVQSCLNSTLHVLVDMLHTHGSDTPSLTLFVQTRGESLDRVKTLIDDLVKRLLGVLPPFMIPSIYLPIEEIPIAATGKTNRKLLRDIGNRLTADEILELQSSILSVEKYQPPSTEIERLLCEICAEVLSLKVNRISTVDSFWRLGGDSITAMHVVAKFRQHGFSLSVADIYRNPVLRDLALATKVIDSISIECDEIPAFSLLESGKNLSVLEAAARSCHAHVEDIEDAYPCTPLQQGMLAVTLKSGTALGDAADYVARTVYELPSDVDLVAFEAAWSSVQETTPILQTQIVNVPGEGLIQVVMKPQVPLYRFNSLSEFIVGSKGMGLGTPLCRAGLIITGIPRFVLEMHHSLFDGWSMMLILDAIEASYRGETSPQLLFPFRSYIKHQIAIDERESILFWQQSLANGSDVRAFPSPTHASGRKSDFSHTLTKLAWPHSGITQSSIIRAALSLLIASYTNSSTVRFGATVSGRQAPIPNIERIAGPTIATVPVQTNVDRNQRLQEFFQQIQNHAVDAIKYEQFGLSRIEQCVDETDLFQLLLIVQPRQLEKLQQNGGLFNKANTVISALEANNTVNTVTKDGQDDTMGLYNPYAVMLICNLDETGVELKFNYDHGVIQKNEIQKIAQQLEHLLRCICDSKTASTLTLRDVTPLTEQDLAEIWMRNPALPETNIKPIVDTIHDRFNMKPESVVISGWDVELTAEELISQSLTLVHRLHAVGIRPGSLVILDFEKSAWFTVAMLAVLKLGAIALPMSSPVPKLRATQVVENLQPQLVIASTSAGNSAFDGLVTTISIMDLLATRFKTPASADSHPHRNHPTDPALILFTSGSTGTPKAILWTHATLSSNINTAVSSFNILDSTRTFQFAGYDFDVSVVEILATLSAGGCICVPHEADRKNRLAGSIKESRANWICLTPSVASTLDVASVTCLQTIVFAGERLENKTAVEWAEQIDMVYNWYGPVEASLATSCVVKPDTWIPGKIGRSYSGSTWLVDPNNPNQLAAVGAVAELYIEGPALASYVGISGPSLNDDGFLEPSWLREGHGKTPGRRGPIYRTGDLVKYGFDGSIIYIGRANDSQRKLRGQRIDLSEIEQHAKEFLESQMNVALVAEIFTPLQSDKEVLALFISPRAPIHTDDNINGYIQTHLPVDGLESHLYTLLPSYMIPKVYVPLAQIPIGTTGKTDRRQLRQLGGFLTLTDLALMQPARQKARKPDTWKEKKLQTIWADILGLNVDEIYATDHFLRLGGDSIAAMRLVGMVDAHGFQLTVTDVFQVPILQDMAEKMTRSTHIIGTDEILPFSLLAQSTSIIEVQYFSARECSVDESQVVDIYPCTSLQQGLLSLGTKTQGQYVSRSVLKLQAGIDPARLERAWRDTAQKLPILRTRIIDLPLHGLHQVVIYDIPWRSGSSIDDYLCADEQEPMGLGTELCRAAIVDLHFILTIHHCLYDGSSLQMILDELEAQYREKPGMVVTPFQLFIKNTSQVKPQDALDYWNTQLSRADFTSFPNLPSLKYEPQASGSLQRSIKIQWPTGTSTPSTILRAAWAILQGQYLATRDVIFGVTVSGRQSSVRGIENCVAPTIATVPVAVCMDRSESVESFLQRVQAQGLDMIPYEQYGLHNIQRAQNDRKNTLFNTLLVVQPVTTGKGLDADSFLFKSRSFASTQNIQGTDAFNIYALMIICQLTLSGLEVRISFDSNIIESRQANRLLAQFETVIHQLCTLSTETTTLGAIQTISSLDLEQLKLQSHHTPTYPTELIHDRMSSLATKYHTDPAINAWDGTFTYAELDAMSTALARRMIFHCGVTKGSVIALCFEKSKYTPVAQFAAWKAGAVTLLVSVDVPEQRMAFVFQHLNVYMALASPSCVDIAKQFTSCMTIEALMDLPIATICSFPTLEMEDPAATLVSSGSTGEPKHILWSHRALAANVSELINQLQPDPNWRVFQFSSYDFDVATLETAMALVSAACLCIPSESERLAKPGESFNHLGANLITLTPSTARFLSPKDVPNLQTLIFAGEKLLQEDVDRWKGHCRIFNWYGPCEFSTASICDTDAPSWNSGTIGHIQNSKCWLVDPFIPNRLVPVGAVGEILLTGPCCAEGYVRNKDLTEEYFLQNHPDFIAEKDSSCKSQGFTAYRTGDLARYDTNGNLVYVGRKDAQLKISGQLVAPKEVERHVHDNLHMYDDCLEVIVDSIMLSTGGDVALVAFLVTEKDMTEGLVDLNHKLQTVLPRYAIPSRYIPIVNIPLTPNGKRDRKEMSRIAEEFSPIEQSQYRRPPSTTSEMALAKLWSLTLGCDIEKVFATDSFLWAGSSIDAMRLVGIARQHGFLLTMADVFVQPILQDMAKRLQSLKDTPEEINEPFTLLGSEHDTKVAIQKAASSCGVEVEAIEDLFPCTQLQAGLLALTIKTPGDYTGRNVWQLAPSTDVEQFKKAWEQVVNTVPILRTSIVYIPDQGFLQAVTRHQNWWSEAKSLSEYLKSDDALPMHAGVPLMRCALIRVEDNVNSTTSPRHHFVLTMHHSIYDGHVMSLIMEVLQSLYHKETPIRLCPFQNFVKAIHSRDKNAEQQYWKDQFDNLEAVPFPVMSASTTQPRTDSSETLVINNLNWRTDGFTPSTIIRAAFALLCSQYSSLSDVVFGTVVMGRKTSIQGTERMAGPTIATVPVRVRIDRQQTVLDLLQDIQVGERDMIPYEQTGLSNIRQVSDEAAQACRFQSLLVVQPPTPIDNEFSLFVADSEHKSGIDRYQSFNSYALSVVCTIAASGLTIEFLYDSNILEPITMKTMAPHLEHILRTLCAKHEPQVPIRNLNMASMADLNDIWRWNAMVPESSDTCIHDLMTDIAQRHPDAQAVCAWDGNLTYAELDHFSTRIASHLVQNGVSKNKIVPLLFEKSMYAVLAIFSVIKAGGATLLLDPSTPDARIRAMLEQIDQTPMLASVSCKQRALQLVPNTLVLGPESELMKLCTVTNVNEDLSELPKVDPSDLLYVVFTSGSTGTPKGCLTQHRHFSSAVAHQRALFNLGTTSRMYDFSSHTFDSIYFTTFHVLASGATLCVPSDHERKNDLTGSVRRFRSTDVVVTPSTAKLMDPSGIPNLRNVYLGGEAVSPEDLSRWMPYGNVVNLYGPSECSAATIFWPVPITMDRKPLIGKGYGVTTWVVDPENGDRLSALGTVGELYLEGPLVGQGYLDNEAKTAEVFVKNPSWLLKGSPDRTVLGRQGRLYKTGDLVKYNTDTGLLSFVGRKDTQVKLRGQRIEISEIEHHVQSCISSRLANCHTLPAVVAEVITPRATGRDTLAVFIQCEQHQLTELLPHLETELPARLPTYMVPAVYVPVAIMPTALSGKTDRRRIREMGADLILGQLNSVNTAGPLLMPQTELERRLQKSWADVLGVPIDEIGTQSSFIRLGGDSISAIRLASLLRDDYLSLTVQSIMSSPRLSDMATSITELEEENDINVPPFSLLRQPVDHGYMVADVAKQCIVESSQVEDIFPCTSVQKSLLSMTAKRENSYIARFFLRLRNDIGIDRFKSAWDDVSKTVAPILRCRIVDSSTQGLVQVQLKEELKWETADNIDNYIKEDQMRPMGLAIPLTRLAIIQDSSSGAHCCFITQHHAVYDGYSLQLLVSEVSKAYNGVFDETPLAPFQAFMKQLISVDPEDAEEFWRREFADSEAIAFPQLPNRDYQPKADSNVKLIMEGFQWPKRDVTPSTCKSLLNRYEFQVYGLIFPIVLRATLSVLISQYIDSEDVVFGAMVTGRQAALPGIDRMVAPLINVVPVRVKLDPQHTVDSLLEAIQKQSTDMIPYEQTELLSIRRINSNTDAGSRFNTLLIVQPPSQLLTNNDEDGPFEQNGKVTMASEGLDDFNPNAVMIMCQLTNTNGLEVEISFDSRVVDSAQMDLLAHQFEHLLRQICTLSTQSVDSIDALGLHDRDQLWKWNETVPVPIETCVHDMISRTIHQNPSAPAICAWDGELTYAELDEISNRLASHLVGLGAGPGTIIPLCFEKSMWHPVAALGIMKSGAACLSMDVSQPEARLQAIVKQVQPVLILSSEKNEILAGKLSDAQVVTLGKAYLQPLTSPVLSVSLPKVSPSDVLYREYLIVLIFLHRFSN